MFEIKSSSLSVNFHFELRDELTEDECFQEFEKKKKKRRSYYGISCNLSVLTRLLCSPFYCCKVYRA